MQDWTSRWEWYRLLMRMEARQLTLRMFSFVLISQSFRECCTNSLSFEQQVPVACAATGVKHLHHLAQSYPVGVYFEANGHGTVLFSERALKQISNHEPQSPAQLEALDTLQALTNLINQTVGDALSDLLLVEVVLAHKEWTVEDWLGTYTDMPNKLAKVLVNDRGHYRTIKGTAERQLESPPGMQDRLNDIMRKYTEGRCFVRASGTEDAVRVYGEASEVYDCEDMVSKVTELIASQSSRDIEPYVHAREEKRVEEIDMGLRRDPRDPPLGNN